MSLYPDQNQIEIMRLSLFVLCVFNCFFVVVFCGYLKNLCFCFDYMSSSYVWGLIYLHFENLNKTSILLFHSFSSGPSAQAPSTSQPGSARPTTRHSFHPPGREAFKCDCGSICMLCVCARDTVSVRKIGW